MISIIYVYVLLTRYKLKKDGNLTSLKMTYSTSDMGGILHNILITITQSEY